MHAKQTFICSSIYFRSMCSIYRKKECSGLRRLGLARAGDWTVWCSAGGSDTVAFGCWVDLAAGEGSDIWNLSILEGTSSLTASWALAVLLVGREVEGDEEEEVRANDAHAGEGSKFLSSTLTSIWQPWEVGRGEVGVGCEVNED